MKTNYLEAQETNLYLVGFIIMAVIAFFALAILFTTLSRKSLTPLNDQIDAMGNHIKKLEKKNKFLEQGLEKVVLLNDSITNQEVIRNLKTLLKNIPE